MNVVLDWNEYIESFSETITNKVTADMQGVVSKAQLYGETASICLEFSNDQMKSACAVHLNIDTVHQNGFLTVTNEVRDGFRRLLIRTVTITKLSRSLRLVSLLLATNLFSTSSTTTYRTALRQ